jgi:hypothetical protein
MKKTLLDRYEVLRLGYEDFTVDELLDTLIEITKMSRVQVDRGWDLIGLGEMWDALEQYKSKEVDQVEIDVGLSVGCFYDENHNMGFFTGFRVNSFGISLNHLEFSCGDHESTVLATIDPNLEIEGNPLYWLECFDVNIDLADTTYDFTISRDHA